MRQAPDAASRRSLVVVAVLVAIAAALRLYGLEHAAGPGTSDEAINAWNAQCLLKHRPRHVWTTLAALLLPLDR
ncbi:MAG: hypothetical protein U0704_17065 [Candidatus Eisenbacteria bacterium]